MNTQTEGYEVNDLWKSEGSRNEKFNSYSEVEMNRFVLWSAMAAVSILTSTAIQAGPVALTITGGLGILAGLS